MEERYKGRGSKRKVKERGRERERERERKVIDREREGGRMEER
jgi:hypothetical protein